MINNANNLTTILNVIRHTTTIVKIMPFMVVASLLIAMFIQVVLEYDTSVEYDMFVYQSPLNILFLIILSYCLKLCIWHRLECLLPLLPTASVFIDEHIYSLSEIAAYVNYGMVVLTFTASLINAYFIFIKPNRIRK